MSSPPRGAGDARAYVIGSAECWKVATLTKNLTVIACAYQTAGYEVPTKHTVVRTMMLGIRWAKGVAATAKALALAAKIRRTVKMLTDNLLGRRDRALLLSFAGAFRVRIWL
jgi:hypothetical protein